MTELAQLVRTLTVLCVDVVGLVWLVGSVVFACRHRGTVRGKAWQFLRTLLPEPWALLLVPVATVLVAVVPRAFWAEVTGWNPVLAVFGLLVAVASAALMVWGRWVLGTMWAARPMVQDAHDLRTTGPYRLVRHPIYTGMAGLAFGAMLAFGFGTAVVPLVCVVPFVALRVRAEEQMMVATFGDAYRDYRSRVPALVPFLR